MINMNFNPQEEKLFLDMLDLTLRTNGLSAFDAVGLLRTRLQLAHSEADRKVAEERAPSIKASKELADG